MFYLADKQVIDTHTNTRTDTQTEAMTIPEGQNWPRVINFIHFAKSCKLLLLYTQTHDKINSVVSNSATRIDPMWVAYQWDTTTAHVIGTWYLSRWPCSSIQCMSYGVAHTIVDTYDRWKMNFAAMLLASHSLPHKIRANTTMMRYFDPFCSFEIPIKSGLKSI